jgi:FkbM family methyltransferase
VSARNERFSQFFLKYASLFSGLRRLPIIGFVMRRVTAKLIPRDSLTWVQIQNGPATGLWLQLNPRTGRTAYEGTGELAVQKAMTKHVRPGMNFYDLGANIGFFTLLAARLVGANGRVTAFEADPEIAKRLKEHVKRNNFLMVAVEQKAVWSEQRRVIFDRSDPAVSPDRGHGHVVSAGAMNAIELEAVALDAYTSGAPAPDFIKCDVEGAEIEVFRGAQKLLREKRPIILCEMHSDENRRAIVSQLASMGYQCTDCDDSHVLALPG